MTGISAKLVADGSLLLAVALCVSASAQTVTYSLGAETDLLDAAFYAGEASDGSNVSGRGVYNASPNTAGTKAILWGVNRNTLQRALFMVDIGDPSSWRRVSADESFGWDEFTWSPDDSLVYISNERAFDVASESILENFLVWNNGHDSASRTYLSTDNWIVTRAWFTNWPVLDSNEIVFLPILPNGYTDISRTPKVITDFGLTSCPTCEAPIFAPYVSKDGSAVAFVVWDSSPNPDIQDVYVLEDIQDILAAPNAVGYTSSLAPTSLSDSRINEVRASDSPNPATVPSFSADGSLIFTSEDYNNSWDAETDFFQNVLNQDFDIVISNRDGTGDTRIAKPLGQATMRPFPTGSRLMYVSCVNSATDCHIFVSTLIAGSDVTAESASLPMGGTTAVIDGNTVPLPFVLSDSGVQITLGTAVADASGTQVDLPLDQVINFPDGTLTPEITIFTPVDPVAPVELPDPQTSIPVIRTFGPAGTQFYPPITIMISYSDAEVEQIADESAMIPYLYNTLTQQYEPIDSEFLPSVAVDTVNNTMSFQTDHFSTYGFGGAALVAAPQRTWMLWIVGALLSVVATMSVWRRGAARGAR